MIEAYLKHEKERAEQGIPALPLDSKQTKELCDLLVNPPAGKGDFLKDLISNRISPGVDPAAQVKAEFLAQVANGEKDCPVISKEESIKLLGTMVGGYNLPPLIKLLTNDALGVWLPLLQLLHTLHP